ncbi:MAG: tetratricopeptide repeat protein [Alphaproteobacteria bacterium]|nr:tetratricopeptide repeat protein [Alphaproteobacteria bacterium SS10]MBV6634231.1 tetratricopeptide repeat protein [Alphaproteobacteria bacterium SS10]
MNEEAVKSEEQEAAPAPSTAANRGKLSDYLAHVERGDKARDEQDFATAIAEYQAAALLRPNMFHPQMMMGKILYQQGLPGEAIGYLQNAHQMQPTNVILLLHIAEMLALMGDNEAAQGVVCDALAIDDKNVNAICMLAHLLHVEEKFDEAIELLQVAIEDAPDEAELWRSVGDVMAAKSDNENAKTFYEEALRLDPALQMAQEGLDKLNANQDTAAEAVH